MPKPLTEEPIPKSHTFPGGYRVKIVQSERGEELEDDEDGNYDTDSQTVYIWVHLTPGQKWRALYHELGHAYIDAHNWAYSETGVK